MIQQRLQNSLVMVLLSGRFPEGSTITIDAAQDGFVFDVKPGSRPLTGHNGSKS